MKVGLVTISGRASSTSVGDVGLVITFSSVVVRIGNVYETTGISPTDVVESVIGSVTTIPSASLVPLAGSG